jgi:hypothetical protein
MFRKIFMAALIVACMSFAASVAEAGILSSLLTYDGVQDDLTDESRSLLVDNDGNHTLSTGDDLFGFIRISNINGSGLSNAQNVVIAFSAVITSGGPIVGNGVYDFTLGPVGAAGPISLTSLLGAGMLPASATPFLSSAIFAVLESSTVNPLTNAAFNSAADAFAQMKLFSPGNWTYDALGGFGSNPDDFFEAELTAKAGGANVSGIEAGGFSILDQVFAGLGVSFLPVDVQHVDGVTVTSHDIGLFNDSSITNQKSGPNIAKWNFVDNAHFGVNPTPEPASLLVWAGLLGTVGLASRRRRANS